MNSRIFINRRAFSLGSLSLVLASAVPTGSDVVADDLVQWLTTPFTKEKDLLRPDVAGELAPEQRLRLGRFASYLISTWGLQGVVEPNIQEITEVLEIKSNSTPSYFTEYRTANETIDRARTSLGSEDRAFDLLSFGIIADDQPDYSRLGRFRRYVLSEVTRYLIASGGFRLFKPAAGFAPARNYQGYIAGPFNNPNYLPYRGLET